MSRTMLCNACSEHSMSVAREHVRNALSLAHLRSIESGLHLTTSPDALSNLY